jgi:DNA invertase Pin-like site-specific DNA recombinase
MNAAHITAENLQRKAVIYIRQSTVSQVMNNVESRKLQLAMREHAKRLGWPDERVEVVESDMGQSGSTAR